MKYIYTAIGYIFAALMFTLAIPQIIIYSTHKIASAVAKMVTKNLE